MFRLPLLFVRALDLTTGPAGRYAARLLGDMGAEVIRIQPPSRAGVDALLDCNKYGCTLDVSGPAGRDALLRLVDLSDIVVAESLGALGLTFDDLSRRNDRLIVLLMPPGDDAMSAIAAAGAAGLALWDRRRTGVGGRIDVPPSQPGASNGAHEAAMLEPVSTLRGVFEVPGPHWRMSESPAHIRLPAPTPAEHNAYVLRDLLGLSDDEIAVLDVG
ncbi:MAG: CoA transferase [Chloroflexota bacterium]|nr:CoA transferase [Chloroflexota bacterium]